MSKTVESKPQDRSKQGDEESKNENGRTDGIDSAYTLSSVPASEKEDEGGYSKQQHYPERGEKPWPGKWQIDRRRGHGEEETSPGKSRCRFD
jgi:hypothetical protein